MALTGTTTHAWTLPSGLPHKVSHWVTSAGVAVAITFSPGSCPAAAHAEFDPTVFSHQYSDPKHPNCKRIVVVKPDNSVALSGADGTPACPEDGSGTIWRLVGEVDGEKLLVDFTPKGGPPNLKGTWDGDGIKWPDGNKWTVKK
jgi:hypothetical protein